MVSMSSTSCSVSNGFLSLNWNSISFDPIHVASTLGGLVVILFFFSTTTSSLMLLITSLWSLPVLTWLMNFTSVTISVLFLSINSISVFGTPFGLFLLILQRDVVFMILSFLGVTHSTKVFVSQFEPKLARCRFHRVCSFPYFSIEVSHRYCVLVWFP